MATVSRNDERLIYEHLHRIESAVASGSTILELGCGTGRDTTILAEFTSHVVAVDISWESLNRCSATVPSADLVQLDLCRGLPFRDDTFPVVVASLSLHYFSWHDSVRIVADIHRCMMIRGLCIVRLNSTKDVHYGANSQSHIEPYYYRVGSRRKRFFDQHSVEKLFRGWIIDLVQERVIRRYDHPKHIWEVVLYAA